MLMFVKELIGSVSFLLKMSLHLDFDLAVLHDYQWLNLETPRAVEVVYLRVVKAAGESRRMFTDKLRLSGLLSVNATD